MKIWIASHECSGISEAGGVKNVTFSLCKELYEAGCQVTLFIPVFKCTSFSEVSDLRENIQNTDLNICDHTEKVFYSTAISKKYGFNVVFVNHGCYAEKEAVYTYTENEEKINPDHKRGQGHFDVKFLDILFAKSVAAYGSLVSESEIPDIIHCQDASTAVIPLFSKNNPNLKNVKNVVTIHNAGPAYHHEFSSIDEAVWYTACDFEYFKNSMNEERVEPFLIAAENGAVLTTVSPDYAKEIKDPINDNTTDGLASLFNRKNIDIKGITNGIDISLYDPKDTSVSSLPYAFDPEYNIENLKGKYECRSYFLEKIKDKDPKILKDIKTYGSIVSNENNVFLVYQGRLASQKGLAVLSEVLPDLLEKFSDLRVIITGQGESELENRFRSLTENENFQNRCLFLNGYNKKAARLTVTSGDFIALPSFFEPCGLEDFIALLYGTLPVAHKTGGLNKIIDGKTGFLYTENTRENLFNAISRAISLKKEKPQQISEMISYGARHTREKYTWDKVCREEYLPFFKELLKN